MQEASLPRSVHSPEPALPALAFSPPRMHPPDLSGSPMMQPPLSLTPDLWPPDVVIRRHWSSLGEAMWAGVCEPEMR